MVRKARAARKQEGQTLTQQQAREQEDGAPREVAHLPERRVDRLAARLPACPPHVLYVAGFLEQDAAAALSAAIDKMDFVALNGRQLSNHGGVPSLSEGGTILEPLPAPLRALAERLRESGLFERAPNQALVNRYRAGEGIAAHSDGPNFKPQAAIVSLQSAVVLHFHSHTLEPAGSVLLEPGSLLFFSDDAFETHKHSIAACCGPCGGPRGSRSPCETSPRCAAYVADFGLLRALLTASLASPRLLQSIDLDSEHIGEELRAERARRDVWWRQAIGS